MQVSDCVAFASANAQSHTHCACPAPAAVPHLMQSMMQSVVQRLGHQVRARISQALAQPESAMQKPKEDFSWLQTFEKQLCSLQSLMFWERPNHTILFLISFHCCYWYDSSCCKTRASLMRNIFIRFIVWSGRVTSFLFTAAFVLSFVTIWKTRIWPEIRGQYTEFCVQ